MTRKLDPEMTCRGKWSVCGGANPSRSAVWHICQECTDKRTIAMDKTAKAPSARKRGPRPSRKPVTATEKKKVDMATKQKKDDKAIRKVIKAQRRAEVRYAPLASDRK